MLAEKKASHFFLLSSDSSKELDVLADYLYMRKSNVFFSTSGLDPIRGVDFEIGHYAKETGDFFKKNEDVIFTEVPFEVNKKQSIVRFLGIEKAFYTFILRQLKDELKSKISFSDSTAAGEKPKFYALKVPDRLVSYDEILSWMEQIPSSVLCLDGGVRYSIFDPKCKILLEDIAPDGITDEVIPEMKFAFIGDSQLINSKQTLLNMLSPFESGHKTEVFVSDDQGVKWSRLSLDCLIKNRNISLLTYGECLKYLDSIEKNQDITHTRFDSFALRSRVESDLLFTIREFLSTPFSEIAYHWDFGKMPQNEEVNTLEYAISFLIRLGFGSSCFLSVVTDFSRFDRTLLSFLSRVLATEREHFLVFRFFFSGIPLSYQNKIACELKKLSGTYVIFDEPGSLCETLLEVSSVIRVSKDSLELPDRKIDSLPLKKSSINDIRRSTVYLLPGDVSLQDEEKRSNFFSSIRESAVSGSLLYVDFSYDKRKNNMYSCFDSFSGILLVIREIFERHPASLMRGFGSNHYSYLSEFGRCVVCSGSGLLSNSAKAASLCHSCLGGRLDPRRYSVVVDGYSFYDIHRAPLSELSSFFLNRLLLKDFYLSCEALDLLSLSLGTAIHQLHYLDFKKIFLLKLLNRLRKNSQCIILDGYFRGVSQKEAEKIIPFITKSCSEGACVVLLDTAKYLLRMLDNEIYLD